jgi:hypothetical protein
VIYTRLRSHASGRRSGDQFCVYVADRLVLPTLSQSEIASIAAGEHQMDAFIRRFIHEHLSYRFVVVPDGAAAFAAEASIKTGKKAHHGERVLSSSICSGGKQPVPFCRPDRTAYPVRVVHAAIHSPDTSIPRVAMPRAEAEVTAALRACVDHARNLIVSAKAVQGAGQPHIAYHLATLALEELGRRQLVVLEATVSDKDDPPAWLGKARTDHVKKLFWCLYSLSDAKWSIRCGSSN